jgi:hypothetical protein
MKYPFLGDDVSLETKVVGGDFSSKKKSPSPKVNISPKLNIWGGRRLKEECCLLEGDISLEMTLHGETFPQGRHGFEELSSPLKETSCPTYKDVFPMGVTLPARGKLPWGL